MIQPWHGIIKQRRRILMVYAWSFPWFWGSCHLDTDTAVISLPWMTVGFFPPAVPSLWTVLFTDLLVPLYYSTAVLDRCFLSSEVFKMLCRTEPKPNWGATRKPDVEDISNNHCLEGAEKLRATWWWLTCHFLWFNRSASHFRVGWIWSVSRYSIRIGTHYWGNKCNLSGNLHPQSSQLAA